MKKALILLSILSINSAQADLWDWMRPAPKVPAHSVSDNHIHQASCLTERLNRYGKNDQFYQDYFDSFKVGKLEKQIRISKKVFKNDYSNMEELYRLLTGHRQYRMSDYCDSIECEINSLFGTTYAQKLVYIAKEFYFNASHLSHRKGRAFSESELDVIIWSFEQLPRFMFQNKMKIMWKDMKDYTGLYATVVGFMENGTGNMTLFKKWAASSMETKAYTIIHEFGHLMGAKLSLHESQEWIKMSGWDKHRSDKVNKAKNLISEYSRSNHLEDFAEAFSAYRMNPTLLKSKAPKKYQMIKDVAFLGKEYLNNDCSSSLVDKTFSEENIDISTLSGTCNFQMLGYRLGLKELDEAVGCLSNNGKDIALIEFNPNRGKYSSKMKENFEIVNYPFISRKIQRETAEKIIESLVPIRR